MQTTGVDAILVSDLKEPYNRKRLLKSQMRGSWRDLSEKFSITWILFSFLIKILLPIPILFIIFIWILCSFKKRHSFTEHRKQIYFLSGTKENPVKQNLKVLKNHQIVPLIGMFLLMQYHGVIASVIGLFSLTVRWEKLSHGSDCAISFRSYPSMRQLKSVSLVWSNSVKILYCFMCTKQANFSIS